MAQSNFHRHVSARHMLLAELSPDQVVLATGLRLDQVERIAANIVRDGLAGTGRGTRAQVHPTRAVRKLAMTAAHESSMAIARHAHRLAVLPPLSPEEERAAIERHLATKGVTRCEPRIAEGAMPSRLQAL